VCAGPVVVDEVPAQQATQMGFVRHHDVVETLAAEGADEPFDIRILPRRPSRRLDFVDPHGLRAPLERDPVHRIAIAQKVSRGTLPGEGLHELLGVHGAVGASVTLMWTTRRRSCARTTKTIVAHVEPPPALLRRGMTYVPQGRNVFPLMTVEENLRLGAYIRPRSAVLDAEVDGVYDTFPMLREARRKRAADLSGGQQQMLEMGRALLLRPRLMLLDEPTLGLAPLVFTRT
jgi:energy-coupling factor transporter ATP-binding protein EcfA2